MVITTMCGRLSASSLSTVGAGRPAMDDRLGQLEESADQQDEGRDQETEEHRTDGLGDHVAVDASEAARHGSDRRVTQVRGK